MTNQTFKKGTGRLSTDRYDFEHHYKDGYFRHTSGQVDNVPPVSIQSVPYSTVASALTAISNYITIDQNNGVGFVAITDDFDTYHNSETTPNTAYDNTIPSINSLLNDIFTNTANPLHHRIRDGGVIMFKAGTYIITDTIDVPPGITFIGEGFGSKIVNAIPYPSLTKRPMFRVKADLTRFIGTTAHDDLGDTNRFMYSKDVKFSNLVLSDNFVEPKFLGDTAYKLPRNIDFVQPLIAVEEGASLTCEEVKFIGKVILSGSVVDGYGATSYAIRTDSTVPNATGTFINVKNCFFDGFSTALEYAAQRIGNDVTNDYVMFNNNYVRAYGHLHNDFSLPQNNAILKLNTCNATITSNYCFGYDNTVTSLVYVTSGATPTSFQAIPRLTVADNNIAIKKSSNSPNSTFKYLRFDSTNFPSPPFFTQVTSLVFGNNFNDLESWALSVNSDTPQLAIIGGGSNEVIINGDLSITGSVLGALTAIGTITGNVVNSTTSILAGTSITATTYVDGYTVASTTSMTAGTSLSVGGDFRTNISHAGGGTYDIGLHPEDIIIIVDSSLGGTTIQLPDIALFPNRQIMIKDGYGVAAGNHIVIATLGNDTIERQVIGTPLTIQFAFHGVTLIADNTKKNWAVIGTVYDPPSSALPAI